MANYKTGVIVSGDSSGAVKSLKATRSQLGALNDTKRRGTKASRDYGNSIGKMSGLLKTLVPVATVAGLASVVKSTLNAVDSIGELSTRIGASTEALSEYRHVADLSGVQFNQLTIGWQRQTRRIAEAAQGTGEAKNALKELGLEATQLARLKPEDQFEAIAKAMEGVGSQSDRVRLGMKLWDSEGVALLQTMKGGASAIAEMREEARELGLSLSSEQVQAADDANDAWTRMTASAKGLTDQLVLKLAPGLTQVIDKFNELAKTEGFFAAVGGALNKAFSNILHGVTPELSAAEQQILELKETIRSMEPAIEAVNVQLNQLEQQGLKGTPAWKAYTNQLDKLKKIVTDSEKKIDLLNKSMEESTDKTKDNTTETDKNTKSRKGNTEAIEDQIGAMEDLLFSLDNELRINYEHGRKLDELTALRAQGSLTEKEYAKQLELTDKWLKESTRSTSELITVTASAHAEVNTFTDAWAEASKRIDETFADAWKGAFNSFGEFKDRLVDSFKDMIGELAHAAITRPILVSMGVVSSGAANASPLGGGQSSLFGGNSIGTSLVNFGDSVGVGLLGNASQYANWQYGVAGLLGGLAGDKLFGGHGGAGGSLGATVGMAFGGPVGAVIGGLAGGAIGGAFGGDDTAYATYTNRRTNAGFEDDVSVRSAFGYLGLADQGSSNIKAGDLRSSFEAIAAIDDLIANAFGPEATSNIANALDGWTEQDRKADDFTERMVARLRLIVRELDFQFADLAEIGANSVEEISTRLLSFKEIADFISSDSLADQARLLADASRTLRDRFDESTSAVRDLGSAYDGTTDATTSLATALRSRYELEIQYLNQISTIQQSLNNTLQGSIESIRLSVMDTRQQYDYFSDQAEALASSLANLTDPTEINETVNRINSLTNQAYGLLSGEQRAEVSGEFVDFLEGVMGQANDRLETERTRAATESEQLRDTLLSAIQQGGEQLAQQLTQSAQQQQQAAATLASGAATFAQAAARPINVNVTYSGFGEVG
ncbi:MAG: hypothetical protein DBP02_15075 [gamma proteobacterium symbiont of Ctena orbiculata]|nr:MAG: hypothetical protein DBP02_15075 [gamma proteobacterium symbiont of Ctena orbiculata]